MSLENLVMSESKKVLKNKNKIKKPYGSESMSKGYWSYLKEPQWPKEQKK